MPGLKYIYIPASIIVRAFQAIKIYYSQALNISRVPYHWYRISWKWKRILVKQLYWNMLLNIIHRVKEHITCCVLIPQTPCNIVTTSVYTYAKCCDSFYSRVLHVSSNFSFVKNHIKTISISVGFSVEMYNSEASNIPSFSYFPGQYLIEINNSPGIWRKYGILW